MWSGVCVCLFVFHLFIFTFSLYLLPPSSRSDLPVDGRELNGVHFAMEFLTRNQQRLLMTTAGTIESAWGKGFVTAEVGGGGEEEEVK